MQKAPFKDIGLLFEAMHAPTNLLHREDCLASDHRWGIGRVHLGTLQPLPQLSTSESVHALLHGDLHNESELRDQLRRRGFNRPEQALGHCSSPCTEHYGRDFVARLRGAFCAAILDEPRRKLLLITDRLGSYNIYWHDGPGRFLFASSLNAILRDAAVEPWLNPHAVADYLTFGFLLGDKTLDTTVRLLPAASILTYDWDQESVGLEQ